MADELEALGAPTLVVPTDISDADQCRRLANAAVERFGAVDVLVNNAFTIDVFKRFADVDLQEWRRLMELNLFGPLQVCQAFVPALTDRGGGSIVFINSMVVRKPARSRGRLRRVEGRAVHRRPGARLLPRTAPRPP